MKESQIIIILTIVLLICGGVFFYLNTFVFQSFTFESAELSANGNKITEKLDYTPNKDYHTLYRDFITIVSDDSFIAEDHIKIDNVICSVGIPYYRDYLNHFYSTETQEVLYYTEKNEYGCSFGNDIGFYKNKDYNIAAIFTLKPTTLTEYKGKHYIKFFAYSANRHTLLIKGKNFKVSDNIVANDLILPQSNVIVFVEYEPEELSNYSIIKVDSLNTGNDWPKLILKILIYILPALISLIVYVKWGKENLEGDYPEELSDYPIKRKTWEVSTYFSPPLGKLDKNFLPSMILDFYYRKILDMKIIKTGVFKTKDLYIRILPTNLKLDEIETSLLDYLKEVEKIEKPKDGYFSIKHASSRLMGYGKALVKYNEIQKLLKKKSKDYIDHTGNIILNVFIPVFFIAAIFIVGDTLFAIVSLIIITLINNKSALFLRFKDDSYLEFQKWQGFKKFLSNSESIKIHPPKGVVVWGEYLVYATALGVGKKVLKVMKDLRIINQESYDSYSRIYVAGAFGAYAGARGGGAGGGFGGGGMGGGGGGGR